MTKAVTPASNVAAPATSPAKPAKPVKPTKPASKKRKKYSRLVGRIVAGLVLLIGGLMVAYPLAANWTYTRAVRIEMENYNRIVDSMDHSDLDRLWKEAQDYNHELGFPKVRDPFSVKEVVSPLDRYEEMLDPTGSGLMGYVEVPTAGIDLPIYHGTTDDILEKGAGHIATTALPVDGTSIHPVITGHTGLPSKMLFTNLMRVKKGDIFRLRILNRTLSYKVTSVDVIEPQDTSKLQPIEGKNMVTLLTCTPYGINSHRLLITGVPTTETGMQATQYPPEWIAWIFVVLLIVLMVVWSRCGTIAYRARIARVGWKLRQRGAAHVRLDVPRLVAVSSEVNSIDDDTGGGDDADAGGGGDGTGEAGGSGLDDTDDDDSGGDDSDNADSDTGSTSDDSDDGKSSDGLAEQEE